MSRLRVRSARAGAASWRLARHVADTPRHARPAPSASTIYDSNLPGSCGLVPTLRAADAAGPGSSPPPLRWRRTRRGVAQGSAPHAPHPRSRMTRRPLVLNVVNDAETLRSHDAQITTIQLLPLPR